MLGKTNKQKKNLLYLCDKCYLIIFNDGLFGDIDGYIVCWKKNGIFMWCDIMNILPL